MCEEVRDPAAPLRYALSLDDARLDMHDLTFGLGDR